MIPHVTVLLKVVAREQPDILAVFVDSEKSGPIYTFNKFSYVEALKRVLKIEMSMRKGI